MAADSKENSILICIISAFNFLLNYTFCHLLESPHGGDSSGMPQCIVLMERYKNGHQVLILSEPRLGCAYVNVLKTRYLRYYI